MLDSLFEVWKPIPGWTHYEASSEGRIRRADTGRIVAQYRQNPGRRNRWTKRYMACSLTHADNAGAGRRKRNATVRVHVLICSAFAGPRPADSEAHHVDEDELNNRASNLEWKGKREHRSDHKRAMVADDADCSDYTDCNDLVYYGPPDDGIPF
jgi:hypothetical protein